MKYEEWSDYPAMVSLFQMFDESGDNKGKRKASALISNYNSIFKQVMQAKLDLECKLYLLKILKYDYVDDKLPTIKFRSEKYSSYLTNYFTARFREAYRIITKEMRRIQSETARERYRIKKEQRANLAQ